MEKEESDKKDRNRFAKKKKNNQVQILAHVHAQKRKKLLIITLHPVSRKICP